MKTISAYVTRILLGISVLIIPVSTSAQKRPAAKDSLHDYCAICEGHNHLIIKPPYTRSFKKELPFILTSAAVFGAGFLVQGLDYAKPYSEEDIINNPPKIEDINSFDRSSADNWSPTIGQASDYVLYTTALLPALFLSEHHTGRDIKVLLVMYAEVFTFNYGATEIAKNFSKRARPYVYNEDLPLSTRTGSDSRKSFFSGHTSQTAAACFYFAKVIHDYHPDFRRGYKIGLWTFAAAVPAVNGYLRVKAGKHFPTDVISGYVVGAASGLLIPQLHRTKSSKDLKEQIQMGVMPYKDGFTFNLAYRL
jgi:membrane-associated phospholipid phosphatase